MAQQGESVPPASLVQDISRYNFAAGARSDAGAIEASASNSPRSDSANVHSDASTETLKEKIDTLRESIVYRMPIVWNTLPVKPDEEIKLFYGKPGDAQ